MTLTLGRSFIGRIIFSGRDTAISFIGQFGKYFCVYIWWTFLSEWAVEHAVVLLYNITYKLGFSFHDFTWQLWIFSTLLPKIPVQFVWAHKGRILCTLHIIWCMPLKDLLGSRAIYPVPSFLTRGSWRIHWIKSIFCLWVGKKHLWYHNSYWN